MQRCSAVACLALCKHGSCRLTDVADQPRTLGVMPFEEHFTQSGRWTRAAMAYSNC